MGARHGIALSNYDFVSYDFDKSIEYLVNCFPLNPHINEFDLRQYDFDAMVVNGEGSFIFSTPTWREALVISILMRWAQRMGKKVYFLNGMLSDSPYSAHDDLGIKAVGRVLEDCTCVQVRDKESFEYAKKYFPNINNLVYLPDALFTWYNLINDNFKVDNGKYVFPMSAATDESFTKYDFSHPYILIAASSSVYEAAQHDEILRSYVLLSNSIKSEFKNYSVYLIISCEGDSFLSEVGRLTGIPVIPLDTPIVSVAKILSSAAFFITGRYHPAILASLGGCPCIFMSSNSHKTTDVQSIMEYQQIKEYNCIPDKNDIIAIIEDAKHILEQGVFLRDKLKKQAYIVSCKSEKIVDLIC